MKFTSDGEKEMRQLLWDVGEGECEGEGEVGAGAVQWGEGEGGQAQSQGEACEGCLPAAGRKPGNTPGPVR